MTMITRYYTIGSPQFIEVSLITTPYMPPQKNNLPQIRTIKK